MHRRSFLKFAGAASGVAALGFDLKKARAEMRELKMFPTMLRIGFADLSAEEAHMFMDEYGIDDLVPISREIVALSERAMREKLGALPAGRYEHGFQIEGEDRPIAEPDRPADGERDENRQHGDLRDDERRLGLSRGQVFQRRHLPKGLYNEDEHVEIEREH